MRSLFAVACASVLSMGPVLASDPKPVVLMQAEQFDVKSKEGLEYRVFVSAPKSKAPESGFPVIYLTDGNWNFPVLQSAVRLQSRGDAGAVVVGIGYPAEDEKTFNARRLFDLTPPTSAEWMKSLPKSGPTLGQSGGNDQFLAFVEDELKPFVEKKYAIDRKRQTLFGHSFGGLFVLHVLFTRPESFQTYIAASPSIWWNDRAVLLEEKAFTERYSGKTVHARLLVTVAEWEQKAGPKVAPERAALLQQRRQVDNAKELVERLKKSQLTGLVVEFREFAEEDHGSVVLPAASRGVRFALDDQP